MLNLDTTLRLIGRWAGTLKFFPSDDQARIGIAAALAAFVTTEEQLRWIVQVVPTKYSEWPGVKELRAVFCMKFRPADGIEVFSDIHPQGFTLEELNPGQKQLGQGGTQRLAGAVADGRTCEPLVVDFKTAEGYARPITAPPEWTELGSGESDIQGLIRVSKQLRHTERRPEPRRATQAEIDAIMATQAANRKGI